MRKFEYKYKIDDKKQTVVALSTFAGKVVRGVARCAPDDSWNPESGKKLAAARCSVRVSEKRMKRAEACLTDAINLLQYAQNYYKNMCVYQEEATKAYAEAVANLAKIESSM